MIEAEHCQIKIIFSALFLQVDVLLIEAPHRVQIHMRVVLGFCPIKRLCVHITSTEVPIKTCHHECRGQVVGAGHFEMDIDLVAIQVG